MSMESIDAQPTIFDVIKLIFLNPDHPMEPIRYISEVMDPLLVYHIIELLMHIPKMKSIRNES